MPDAETAAAARRRAGSGTSLRALDALQLASALTAGMALDACAFGCFDDRLNTAAASDGLALRW